MIVDYIKLMTTLGVLIMLILLLIIIPLLIKIKKKQKEINCCTEDLINAIAKLNNNVVLNEEMMMNNFKETIGKLITIDSKEMSVSDMLKDIIKGLGVYHTKTMNAISAIKPSSNKRTQSPKTKGPQDNTGNTL